MDPQIHAASALSCGSYSPIFRHGPSGAQVLEGAVRYASPFNYQHEATTLLPNSDFLSLPDHVTQYAPVRAQTLGLYIPESIQQWLLAGAPRIYDRRDLELPANRQIAVPSILTRYFCSELTIHQFTALLNARNAEDDKELDAAFFFLAAAWLNEAVVRAVALLSAKNKWKVANHWKRFPI